MNTKEVIVNFGVNEQIVTQMDLNAGIFIQITQKKNNEHKGN